jgi:hypothetical protein
MSNKNLQPIRKGFLGEIILQTKLVYRLMRDKRINFFLKFLPFIGVVYLVFPDLLPGPVDDAAIILTGSYLFVEFCPRVIVDEHLRLLRGEETENQNSVPPTGDIIDAEFHDVDEK